jgi:WhiB family transcriptional regulator, redox-sensing transcriptional regulator
MTRRCGADASSTQWGPGGVEAREVSVNGAESGSVVLGSDAVRAFGPVGQAPLRDVLSELAMVTEDEQEWQERALCAQTDPEAFFPEKGGSTREAKQICNSCDVRSECLEYALGHDERFGIWGGLSERERRRLKRRAFDTMDAVDAV